MHLVSAPTSAAKGYVFVCICVGFEGEKGRRRTRASLDWRTRRSKEPQQTTTSLYISVYISNLFLLLLLVYSDHLTPLFLTYWVDETTTHTQLSMRRIMVFLYIQERRRGRFWGGKGGVQCAAFERMVIVERGQSQS